MTAYKPHHAPASREPSALTLFFRTALRRVTRKPAAPEVTTVPSGAAEGGGSFYDDAAPRFPCCGHCVSGGLNLCDPRDRHPVACSDGCNAPVLVHPATDPAGIPVLGDRMISEVRAGYDGEPYAPAPWRPQPSFTPPLPPGPITAHANAIQAMSARYLPAPPRPVNGRSLGTRPRVYGQAPQLEVQRAEYLRDEQAEADRARYVRSQMREAMFARDPQTLRQVLTGLRKL